jgi:hypothetical protein
MASGRFAPWITQAWLVGPQIPPLKDIPQWAALVSSDPYLVSDPLAVEVLGDAYRRPQFTPQVVDQILRNAAALSWTVGPMTRIAGIAGFDAAFNGRLMWYTPLPDALDYPAGGSVSFPAREIYLGVDS